MSPVYFIALPLFAAFGYRGVEALGRRAVAMALLMESAALLLLAASFVGGGRVVENIAIVQPLAISLVIDSASLFFVMLITLSMTLFSLHYLFRRAESAQKHEGRYFVFLNLLMAGTLGLVLSADIFNLYVFIEITGISAYVLTAFQKSEQALEGGIKYLIIGSVASLFVFFAIILIYLELGTFNLALIAKNFSSMPGPIIFVISLLGFIGLGIKAKLFPLNFWVPDIYEAAHPEIASLFSAIMASAYIFLFFHLFYLFGIGFREFVMTAGIVTMIVAELAALRQNDMKRIFAYSSIGQAGLVIAALALGNPHATTGAFFLLINNALAKLLLFIIVSVLFYRFGSTHIDTLKKVGSKVTVAALLMAFLTLLGMPPFGGFVGKFLVLEGFAEKGAYMAFGAILVAALIEAGYYFKMAGMLVGPNRSPETLPLSIGYRSLFLLIPGLFLLLGIAFFLFLPYFGESAATLSDAQGFVATLLGGVK